VSEELETQVPETSETESTTTATATAESSQPAASEARVRPRGRYVPRRKVCAFCADHIDKVDYKDIARIGRYLSDRAKIEGRRKTGTCAKHQRSLAVALKRARYMALMPYTAQHIRP